ncbi:hypothetical protein TNCV_3422821 [Trichonephila clavipes]|nr:hypothetical protein TNCV_3422821 [Trichonephila clavipes]
MAGEAVSLHSLLANRNCKIYRQNFEADDFPSGAVNLFKGGRANSRGFLLFLRLPEKPTTAGKRTCYPSRKTQRWENVVKAPKSEGVVDPKSGEHRRVSLLLSGSRGRKGAPKGDSSRCVWRKQTAMSAHDNI